MNIGVLGVGFVGGATAQVLKQAHNVFCYDKYKKEMNNISVLKNCQIILLCLPTPMKSSGEIDFSAIHNSMESLEKLFFGIPRDKRPLLILRSTAVSGTTESLEKKYNFNFAFNPEFLREKYAIEDMMKTDRVVIGAKRKEDIELAHKMYMALFPKAKYIFVDTKTAEMIKYAANVMLLGQISIANELYQVCKAIGVDYDIVRKTILMDERIGKNIAVPGPDGDLGFGGKCFPKDLNALIYLAREHHYRPYLLEEFWRLNEKVRANKDWLNIPGATTQKGFELKSDEENKN